jgi:hypothetical protein
VFRSVRWFLLLLSLLVLARIPLFAADWTKPTSQELKMTKDPMAPNAPAVYLDWDATVNDPMHYTQVYARVKILSQEGVSDYSDVRIGYGSFETREMESGGYSVSFVEGRTIEPDGTVVPFAGKPFSKETASYNRSDKTWVSNVKQMETVFTMPDVRVGSILEYRYQLTANNTFTLPQWNLQQPIFAHHEHFQFVPTTNLALISRDRWGHWNRVQDLLFTPILPSGSKVQQTINGYELDVKNVPAAPDEAYMPPLSSFGYQLLFSSTKQFWSEEGKYWSKDVDRFADSSDAIKAAVAQVVSPGDSDERKLEKIYAAVTALDNTDFTRTHTEQENKAQGAKTKTAADIWANKRGDSNEIVRLFIALARTAGMKAYAMATTDRRYALMNPSILDWGQLTDEVAIVTLNGKEVDFDPGDRDCAYGRLGWIHAQMLGIRQTDNGTEEATLPPQNYTDNETFRKADLTLAADGTVQGDIHIIMKGEDALHWRQDALTNDAEQAQKDFEKAMQSRVPDGVHVKMEGFDALTDPTANLVATLDVSGTMGTTTGKRLIVPAAFFEANVKPPFAPETRENPIDMRYPYAQQDQVTISLGPGLSVESLPQGSAIPMAKGGEYKSVYSQTGAGYTGMRLMALGNTIFTQKDYPMLRSFFQGASAQDQEQVVLRRAK